MIYCRYEICQCDKAGHLLRYCCFLMLFPTFSSTLGVKMPGWLWGAVVQWPEHLWLKQEVLGGCPGFFFSFS